MPVRESLRFTTAAAVVVVSLFQAESVAIDAQTPSARDGQTGTPTVVTGRLTALAVDHFAQGRADRMYMVRDERTGKSFTLRFDGAAPRDLRSGMRVTVRGYARESTIYLAAAGSVSIDSNEPNIQPGAIPVGDQKTLVVIANFRDKVLDPLFPGEDCSAAAIQDRMFSDPLDRSVDDMYRQASLGRLSFSGRVVGPFTIDVASTDACDLTAWTAAADAAATAAGADPSTYTRRVYMMPTNTCPWAGVAELATLPSKAWVFTCDRPHVYAHELGHNLGMQHASTETHEYGDDSDTMGMLGGLKPVNAPHKLQMAWLPESQVRVVTEPGLYEVAPLAMDSSTVAAPQILKVARPDSTESYFLSYRHGTGFEANACCSYLDRVNVHRWRGGAEKTVFLAALADGESYVDPVNGFTVTQISHGETATVDVRPGTGCGATAASVTLSPVDQSASPGTAVTYGVSVLNNDATSCAASTFNLARAVPTGWNAVLSLGSLQLSPGALGQATLTVVSPYTAASGAYAIGVSVSDVIAPTHRASATATYTVPNADSAPPTTPTALEGTTKRRQVQLKWQASTDNVAVVGYQVWRNGTMVGTTATTAWSDSAPDTTTTYYVRAFDVAGNISSPSNSVSLSASVRRR